MHAPTDESPPATSVNPELAILWQPKLGLRWSLHSAMISNRPRWLGGSVSMTLGPTKQATEGEPIGLTSSSLNRCRQILAPARWDAYCQQTLRASLPLITC